MNNILASAKTTTPAAPGINDQVVNELKDAATTVRSKTTEFFQNLPSFLLRYLSA